MYEITVNLHMHTRYSDGTGTHEELAKAAIAAGIDAIIITDHNVWVEGIEGYFREGPRRVLVLIGEEVHDRERTPQGNHLLVFGAGREMSMYAQDPQQLLDKVNQAGGISFLAHPFEKDAPAIHEPALAWMDWDIYGFTGLEIWNEMSEFKSRLTSKLAAAPYVFFPAWLARGPSREAVERWDELLAAGKRMVAIGGTDAHAFNFMLGPVKKVIFPYEFHFRALNTHLLLREPLTGDTERDRGMILEALHQGCCFIGYDLPAPTTGFRFSAHGKQGRAWMGEEISATEGVTIQIKVPRRTPCRLLKNGATVKKWNDRETCTHITTEPGIYRVEVDIQYKGRLRSWIVSNPIYVVE